MFSRRNAFLHPSVLLVAACVFAPSRVGATVPTQVNIQGVLRSSQGALQSKMVNVSVVISDAQMNGKRLAGTQSPIPVMAQDGLFTMPLTFSADDIKAISGAAQAWLQVVAGDDTFPPQLLGSDMFALLCGNADTATDASQLGGVAAASYALKSDLTGGSIKVAACSAADSATNASQLGGVEASSYALKSQLTGGTVTSVSVGDGLQGGPITTSGTISVDSSVSRSGHAHSLSCFRQDATNQANNFSFAQCPGGTVVVGGGCAMLGGNFGSLNRASPSTDPNVPNAWACTTADGTTPTSYAICCHTTIQ